MDYTAVGNFQTQYLTTILTKKTLLPTIKNREQQGTLKRISFTVQNRTGKYKEFMLELRAENTETLLSPRLC